MLLDHLNHILDVQRFIELLRHLNEVHKPEHRVLLTPDKYVTPDNKAVTNKILLITCILYMLNWFKTIVFQLNNAKGCNMLRPKFWYREFSRISNIGITIIEKWITFRDRDALNSNPVII